MYLDDRELADVHDVVACEQRIMSKSTGDEKWADLEKW